MASRDLAASAPDPFVARPAGPAAGRRERRARRRELAQTYDLTDSARSIVALLASKGPATRPTISKRLDLSKPTVSTAIAELARHRLVRDLGTTYGRTGRSAVVYGLGPASGYALGIDIGRTRAIVVGQALDGSSVIEAEAAARPRRADGTWDLSCAREPVRSVVERIRAAGSAVRAATIALPTTISGTGIGDLPIEAYQNAVQDLFDDDETTVSVENNVNCAAIAEISHGAARGKETFAYLQVGLRVGVGLVIGKGLIRGANGFAGEVSNIPFPWTPRSSPKPQGLERHLGAASLMQRSARRWPVGDPERPATAAQLFSLAEGGSTVARELVAEHGRDIGRLAAVLVTVLDPGLVVLGGGVGQNPMLLPFVRDEVSKLGWETDIKTSSLGPGGTALGAAHLATGISLEMIVR